MVRFLPHGTRAAAAAVCALLLLGACGDSESVTEPGGAADAYSAQGTPGAPLVVTPAALAFDVPPGGSATITATVQFNGLITAATTDAACASVDPLDVPPEKPAGSSVYVATFTVAAVGVGDCSVIVTDKRGRSVTVPVTVKPPPPPRLVFLSGRDGNAEIYSMALDGSNVVRLTKTLEDESGPTISADGRRMLFKRNVGGEWHMFTARYDGSDVMPFPALDDVLYFTFTPDGSQIAFTKRVGDDTRLGIMDASGANAVWVTPEGLSVNSPRFIPGTTPLALAFTSLRTLWRINADGTGAMELADLADWQHTATFNISVAPDGSRIAFDCQPDAHVQDICLMGVDGTNPVRLTDGTGQDRSPMFAPDGRVVFTRTVSSPFDSEVMAINADGTGLVNLTSNPSSWDIAGH